MRFLTFVCFILVLLNVTAYLWPDRTNHAPHVQSEKPDVNPNYLRLNKEIEDDYYRRVDNGSVAEGATAGDVFGLSEEVELSSCYRVGPFVDPESYDLAQAVLVDAQVDFEKSRRESKESNVFRVFVGPFDSQEQAVDARADLRSKEILDHFIRKNSEDQPIVSLGIYTTQEAVDDAMALFSQVLNDVRFENELVLLPESFWLHFALDDENEALQQLQLVDWGELAAKMGKFECQS